MRRLFPVPVLLLAACSPVGGTGSGATPPGPVPGAQQALFDAYPEPLFVLAEQVCSTPAEIAIRPNRDEFRCERLPDPQTAGSLILEFDGTIDALPRFVLRLSGAETTEGYLVTADNFILVPLAAGGTRIITFPDPETERAWQEILTRIGGTVVN